jgi:hypothetical protein
MDEMSLVREFATLKSGAVFDILRGAAAHRAAVG